MPTYTPNYNLAKPLVNDPTDEDLWGDELNSDLDIIDTAMKAIADSVVGAPAGSIIAYGGINAPSGYLLCYGQAVSRATYAALFTAIATNFGMGDGSTTFNVPDLRGRSVAGKDNMGGTSADRLTGLPGGIDGDTLGATGGLETHTLTTAQLASHTHTGTTASSTVSVTIPSAVGTPSSTVAGAIPGATLTGGDPVTSSASGAHTHTFTSAASGSGSAHNNVQPTLILNYIIKT